MRIFGAVLGVLIVATVYLTWGLTWKGDIAVAVVGIVLTQVGHSKGWREIAVVAGSTCLFAAVIATLLLLLQLFMG